MKITTVLFDLDGTLLPMEQDEFVKAYFGRLAKKLAPHGYEPEALIEAIWSGTKAMIKNDGRQSNEAAFWEDFCKRFGEAAKAHLPLFDDFYRTDFSGVQSVCGYQPEAANTVAMIKAKGLRVALATNPIFPAIATEQRIAWAGLSPSDFEIYTTYENSRFCKPNPRYYQDILEQLQVKPEQCLMVGNDVIEDMAAKGLGMQVFLLTDDIINRKNEDISAYPHGGYAQLQAFLQEL